VTAEAGQVVRVDPVPNPISVLFPRSSQNYGLPIIVKAVALSSNPVTVLPSGADTIDGGTSFAMTPATTRTSLVFVADGVNDWMLVAQYQ
jgi:hypothetical protein